jgi:hypothetical protein
MKILTILAAFVLTLGSLSQSQAATCYAITQGNRLLTFDSATPGTVTNDVAISGINAAYSVVGIDIRTTVQPGSSNPGVGSLWGIAYNSAASAGQEFFLCVINPTTGVAQQIGGFLGMDDTANADAFGFGFDSTADRFRFISVQTNYEINPNTASFIQQTSFAGFPAHSGAAFTTSPYTGGIGQFYNVSRQVNPRPLQTSSNIANGVVTNVGPILMGLSAPMGLDIEGSLTLLAADNNLYSLNRSTGTATLVGVIMGMPAIRGLAIVPASFPPKLSIAVKISGKKTVTTTAPTRTIRGTVKSNGTVTLVEYRVGTKGKFKKAKGTTKWSFKASLKKGKNIISVRAKAGTTFSKIAKVTVIRK